MVEIAFTKVALPYGWLGNMSPHPVRHDEVDHRTSEALFQALRFVKHPEVQALIRDQRSPMAAKMVMKSHRSLLLADGYEVMGEQDLANMRLCLKLKVDQHPSLRQALLDTGDATLIEDSSRRMNTSGLFWGAGRQDGQWVGRNWLGRLWEERRDLERTAS